MSDDFLKKSSLLQSRIEPYGWLSKTGLPSPFASCVAPLLTALSWNGEVHQICESLPHYPDQIDRVDFINTMANLNYQIQHASVKQLTGFDARLAPCLVVVNEGGDQEIPYIVFSDSKSTLHAFDGKSQECVPFTTITKSSGTIYTFQALDENGLDKNKLNQQVHEKPSRWARFLGSRFTPVFKQIFVSSFVINLLALVSSLFVMAVYDKVIGNNSPDTLYFLAIGALMAIGFESLLRYLRARSLAFFGVRLDSIITQSIFERLLYLPPRIVESSSIPAQIARLKDFDSVRNFFSGPVGTNLVEIPFTLIFIFTIYFIGGPLVRIPILLALFYSLLGFIMLPRIQNCTEEGAVASVQRQTLMVETMQKFRPIRIHGAMDTWFERFRKLSGISAYTSFKSSQQTAFVEAIAYGLSVGAGVGTLVYGIFLVWEQQITTGALIASMMLVWRVISPLQSICNSLVRIRYIFRSVGQVHKLLRSAPENSTTLSDQPFTITGNISFSGVGLRYTADRGAVFSGMTLNIKAGEVVAVAGPSGSGKSSLLKIIIGLYPPQMGAVLIDGLDIRQRDPIALRRNIAYTPQTPELFHGSIEQNLRMCKPDATPEELNNCLYLAGALDDVNHFEEGISYFIGDYKSEQLSTTLTYQLTLARTYLRDASIFLFDEMPPTLLGKKTGIFFREFLQNNRGSKTMLYVTDHEEDILKADKLIYLTGTGQVLIGDPAELLTALKK
ncbi:ABC-type bacteriocin/lantibiotic exporter [Desulfocapsa sulfexigens DSM 10523]|uniref:ABC-type bacteriocin/lantibiotic exporter n=1 Tax=Desulfocapsa sulfexigens (strain DSM 10523 / SB164P1) TaxID=1167006 RepID=M1PKK2_DESSD|nr:ATP-binding cassette domain-containing protein [Desulfocapsa sulfexigens]AGF80035.1 ABC-type bacteriocin/lantibiotic exporter [Desulfocapsa sulfexigens DSM 10523]